MAGFSVNWGFVPVILIELLFYFLPVIVLHVSVDQNRGVQLIVHVLNWEYQGIGLVLFDGSECKRNLAFFHVKTDLGPGFKPFRFYKLDCIVNWWQSLNNRTCGWCRLIASIVCTITIESLIPLVSIIRIIVVIPAVLMVSESIFLHEIRLILWIVIVEVSVIVVSSESVSPMTAILLILVTSKASKSTSTSVASSVPASLSALAPVVIVASVVIAVPSFLVVVVIFPVASSRLKACV